jgi:hypothetical protein
MANSSALLPPVQEGDPISARAENALRSTHNALILGGDGLGSTGRARTIRVSVYNAGSATLVAGAAVALTQTDDSALKLGGAPDGYIYAAVLADEGATSFAVLDGALDASAIGSAIVIGLVGVTVAMNAATDGYVKAASSGALQSCASSGCQILWKAGTTGSQSCLLLLGGSGSSSTAMVFCQITAVAGGLYTVALYENGFAQASTGTGTMQVVDMALAPSCYLAVGERYIAPKVAITATGDSA